MITSREAMQLASDLSAVHYAISYWYNTAPEIVLRTIFPDAEYSHIKDKMYYFSGFDRFWNILDWDHRAAFLKAAAEKYAEESLNKVKTYVMEKHVIE